MNKEYSKLSKNAIKSMYVASAILNIIFAGVVALVWRMFFADEFWAMYVAIALWVACALDFVLSPYVRYHRYRYCIDEECIDIMEGFIYITRNIVPIERLHKLAVSRGPIDRIFGLGKVEVTTAGGDVVIRFLEIEKAEMIAESLKHRINQIASEEKQG